MPLRALFYSPCLVADHSASGAGDAGLLVAFLSLRVLELDDAQLGTAPGLGVALQDTNCTNFRLPRTPRPLFVPLNVCACEHRRAVPINFIPN